MSGRGLGQPPNLVGHDREAPSGVAGVRRLYGRVHREEIGLGRDGGDDLVRLEQGLRAGGNLPYARPGRGLGRLALLGGNEQGAELLGHLVDRSGDGGDIADHLFDRGGSLGDARRLVGDEVFQGLDILRDLFDGARGFDDAGRLELSLLANPAHVRGYLHHRPRRIVGALPELIPKTVQPGLRGLQVGNARGQAVAERVDHARDRPELIHREDGYPAAEILLRGR